MRDQLDQFETDSIPGSPDSSILTGDHVDLFWVDETVPRPDRVVEPTGMSVDELLEWYLEQPAPFRRKQRQRIAELFLGDHFLAATGVLQ